MNFAVIPATVTGDKEYVSEHPGKLVMSEESNKDQSNAETESSEDAGDLEIKSEENTMTEEKVNTQATEEVTETKIVKEEVTKPVATETKETKTEVSAPSIDVNVLKEVLSEAIKQAIDPIKAEISELKEAKETKETEAKVEPKAEVKEKVVKTKSVVEDTSSNENWDGFVLETTGTGRYSLWKMPDKNGRLI